MKAGHRRALVRLSRMIARHRCPICIEDTRQPRVLLSGVECPYCGWIDESRKVVISTVTTRAGFRWSASLVDTARPLG